MCLKKPTKYFFLGAVLFLMSACGMPPFNPKAVLDKFPENAPPQYNTVSLGERTMHYASYGDTQKPLIVFVHGSPGGWEAYGHFMADPDLYSKAHLIAVDRLGFGKSDKGRWEPSLEIQANLVAEVIKKEANGRKAFVIGHSYGGPVMARLVMDHPDLVSSMIMLAASVDPALEKMKWFNYAADTWVIGAVLPSMWKVSNKEILPLKGELEKIQNRWGEITHELIVIQGTKDTLVPEGNAHFIKEHAINAGVELIILEGENHFLPWNQELLIKQQILSRL